MATSSSGVTSATPGGIEPPRHVFGPAAVNLMVGLVMASLLGMFAYRHTLAFHNTGEWGYLVVSVSETLSAALFLFRSTPVTVSKNPLDWFFAVGGTFLPLLFVPSSWGLAPAARHLIIAGTVLQILGMLSLNRSYALVAAKRVIKTGGMYRFVRHPMYASYVLVFTGYVLSNSTWMNFFLFLLTMASLLVRLIREEKHLVTDAAYAEYAQRVRFRVIPFVF